MGLAIGDLCVVYDFNASRLAGRPIWHERRSTITELVNKQQRWRVQSMVKAYDRIIVGDQLTGRIGSISLNTFDEYDAFIRRSLSTRPLSEQSEHLFIDQLELTLESGVTDDVDNVIKMHWSDDNKIFNDLLPAQIGTTGQYGLRQFWRRLGYAPRWRTFEFIYTGRDKSALMKAEVVLDAASE